MITRFIRGCRYRHKTATDLDIEVVSVQFFNLEKSVLKIKWINKYNGKHVVFPGGRVDGTDRVEIASQHYTLWSLLK